MFPREWEQAMVKTAPCVQPGPGSGHPWGTAAAELAAWEGSKHLLGPLAACLFLCLQLC